ncbi:MAG: RlpA-like double-psi beta-barrel domain-containing protein [Coriobacteriia bacterium]
MRHSGAILGGMFSRRTVALAVAIALATGLLGLRAVPAVAVSPSDQMAADRAELEDAVAEYEAAQSAAAEIDARIAAANADLDLATAAEAQCQERLRARVVSMYRSGDADALSILLTSDTIQDLVARMDLLERVSRQTAENLEDLGDARARATAAAEELLPLQSEQARALDELAAKVATARAEFAASEAALREYEARVAAAAAAAAAAARARAKPVAGNPSQDLAGTGNWQVGVASHYGINFTGRGANGEPIGPYTMMVAHKTLPFGTLIEFEYNGKRAVAKVADRGPYTPGRDFDLGPGVVRVLGFDGVHQVRYRIISQ